MGGDAGIAGVNTAVPPQQRQNDDERAGGGKGHEAVAVFHLPHLGVVCVCVRVCACVFVRAWYSSLS